MHPYKTHHLNFSRHKGTKTKHTHLHTTTKFITCTHNPLTKPHPLLYHHFPPFPLPSSAPALPAMANASLQSFLLHHHHSFLNSSIHDSSHSIILKLTTSTSVSFKLFSNNSSVTTASTPNSSAPTPATPDATTSPPPPSLDLLGRQLAGGDYRQADETTRALLIDLAGESARRRGYVFFSEVQFISADDLRAIDTLWREHSNGKFGYSVQRRLWEKSRRDFTRFFIKVGWMKKLDTEVEQFNYRAFPDEFIWELNDDTPEGHLPLTNALRGTQLLGNILTHPAFEDSRQEATEEENNTAATTDQSKDDNKGRERPQLRDFKPDYSF